MANRNISAFLSAYTAQIIRASGKDARLRNLVRCFASLRNRYFKWDATRRNRVLDVGVCRASISHSMAYCSAITRVLDFFGARIYAAVLCRRVRFFGASLVRRRNGAFTYNMFAFFILEFSSFFSAAWADYFTGNSGLLCFFGLIARYAVSLLLRVGLFG